jgi:hypothetical protein
VALTLQFWLLQCRTEACADDLRKLIKKIACPADARSVPAPKRVLCTMLTTIHLSNSPME